MLSPTNVKIARVHLTSKMKQTVVALLGVVFGISMYVFMNSFMAGVNDTQTRLAFTSLAHIRIYNDGPPDNTNLVKKAFPPSSLVNVRNAKVIRYTDGIKSSADMLALIGKQPEVTGIAPQVNINVFFRSGGNKMSGILSGVDVEKEKKLFNISSYMIAGNWDELLYRQNGVIVGADMAKSMSLNINDNVNILTSDNVAQNYKVIGVFRTYDVSVDKSKAYLNINAARQLLAKNQEYVTDLQVDIRDFRHTEGLVRRLASVLPYKVESWQMAKEGMLAGSKLRDWIAMTVSITILLVAGFGIYNILNMTINERIREIAILKAMGFSGRDIREIFLIQATIIGITGGIAGMLTGWLVCVGVNHIPFKLSGLDHLPMAYQAKDYGMSFFFGLLTTLLAGYLPARKASGVDPVIIIRG